MILLALVLLLKDILEIEVDDEEIQHKVLIVMIMMMVFFSLTVTVSGVPADQDDVFEVEGNTYTVYSTAVPDDSDDSDANFCPGY